MDRLATDYAALNEATDPTLALAQLGKQGVLTAVRKGTAGSETITAGITERLARRFDFNPATIWYQGRPVMVTRNDYRGGLGSGLVLCAQDCRCQIYFGCFGDCRGQVYFGCFYRDLLARTARPAMVIF